MYIICIILGSCAPSADVLLVCIMLHGNDLKIYTVILLLLLLVVVVVVVVVEVVVVIVVIVIVIHYLK